MSPADSGDELRVQMWKLAASFVRPGLGPDPDKAIRLACDLIVRDLDTPAAVSVAALSYGTTLRDAGPLIRDMFTDQGIPLPGEDATDDERLGFMMRGFANGGLDYGEFFTAFIGAVPRWENQNESQREIVRLINALDEETSPEGKARVIASMRAAAGL